MSANFIPNGDGTTTIEISYTAITEKITAFGENAAEFVYPEYPVYEDGTGIPGVDGPQAIPFNQLTNVQKLSILDQYILDRISWAARQNLIKKAIEAAREDAEADDSIDLGV